MTQKKILLFCYYNLNLGDDLFIKLIIDYFGYDKVDLLVPEDTDKYYFDNYNVQIYSKLLRRIDRAFYTVLKRSPCLKNIVKKYDKVVILGGSMFIQKKGWQSSLRMYKMLEKTSKEFYVIGSNFGPYSTENFLNKYRLLFKKAKQVTFRDEYSKELMNGLDCKVYPDLIFNQPKPKVQKSKEKILGISVINLEGRNYSHQIKKNYIDSLIDICKSFSLNGYEIRLFAFCEPEGDKKTCDILQQRMNNIKVYNYTGKINDFLLSLNECSLIIASRFHAMILGWDFNIPTLPIVYSNKSLNVIFDLKQNIGYKKIENITSNINLEDFSTLRNLSEIKKSAIEHLKVLRDDNQ